MILYIENPVGSTKKLLDLIYEFNKVPRFKINTQKLMTYLYPNNELSEKETKKTILFTIASKNNKIPRNKFNKEGEKPVY